MAAQPAPRVPRRPKLNPEQVKLRQSLLNSFHGFSSNAVTKEHERNALMFIEHGGRPLGRYSHIPFCQIMEQNKDEQDYLTIMIGAYDILLKYVINLLKPNRPPSWRSIKTTTPFFKCRVQCMKGATDVLKIIGYTKESPKSVEFPPEVSPDEEKLYVIAAEILMAKLEVEKMRREAEEKGRDVVGESLPTPDQAAPPGSQQVSGWTEQQLYKQTPGEPSYGSSSYPREAEEGSVPSHRASGQEQTQPPTVHPRKHNSQQQQQQQQQLSSLDSHGSSGGSTGDSPHTSLEPSGQGLDEHDDFLKRLRQQKANIHKKIKSEQHGPAKVDLPVDLGGGGVSHRPSIRTEPVAVIQLDKRSRTPEAFSSSRNAPQLPAPSKVLPPLHENGPEPISLPTTATRGSPHASQKMGGAILDAAGIIRPPTTKYPEFRTDVPMQNLAGLGTDAQIRNTLSASSTGGPLPEKEARPTQGTRFPGSAKAAEIVRAKPSDVIQVEQHHRRTHVFPSQPNSHLTPVSTGLFEPVVSKHPYHTPLATGQIDPHTPFLRREPETSQPATGHRPASSSSLGTKPSATGMTTPHAAAATGTSEKRYTDKLTEKFHAWNQHKEKCYLEGRPVDYSVMPSELGDREKAKKADEEKRRRSSPQSSRRRAKKDPRGFCKEPVVNLPRLKQNDELSRKMKNMVSQGLNLLEWIKVCHSHGYSLEEIQIAVQKSSEKKCTPLQYLQMEWSRIVRNVQLWVGQFNEDNGQSVGCPTEVEARKFLVECGGDNFLAVNKCHEYRTKQVQELLKRANGRLPEVNWKIAVQALCANDMDVTTAFCALQAEGLQPLYDYVFGEWQKVKRDDMEELKTQINEGRIEAEALHRLLMAEYRFETAEKAKMVPDLMKEVGGEDYPLHYFIDAAKSYDNMEDAVKFLQQPCPICTMDYPIQDMLTMPGCADSVCKTCFKEHFKITIQEKTVKHFNCPVCGKPDLSERGQDIYLELFVHMVKEHVSHEAYTLCNEKLRDFDLSKDPNFRWCANDQCRSGFINETRNKKIGCPMCKHYMCFKCQKPWENQHEGLSCAEFAQWKSDNDPEAQEQGLAAHLKANGIECPACHMRYSLARGGCMHFKCTQCPNEFCSGCGQSFKNGKACGKLKSCEKKGLHAHHPRDCLFYLRDFDVAELQQFLEKHGVKFDTEPPKGQVDAAKAKQRAEQEEAEAGEAAAVEGEPKEGEKEVQLKCHVMLQKELVDGLVDEECGKDAPDGHAGLCVTHYKEYLVGRINSAKKDPVTMYATPKVRVMLVREEVEEPEQEEEESDEEYRERLIKFVQERMPLER